MSPGLTSCLPRSPPPVTVLYTSSARKEADSKDKTEGISSCSKVMPPIRRTTHLPHLILSADSELAVSEAGHGF